MKKAYTIDFKANTDNRGTLIAVEQGTNLHFNINRVFYMFGMESGAARGSHANRNTTMCFIAVKGSCKIQADNGEEQETFVLDNPARGLVCQAMTWKKMYDFSPGCILMVICDTNFDPEEYIDDYDDFITEAKKGNTK
jgi:dTDP-4-dehydrorhamnose 3,5-epimerase-like enzyme